MVEIQVFLKRFEGLQKFIDKRAANILYKHREKIVELNNKQLMQGKGIDGKIMQRGYSTGYAKRRKKKGLQTSFVDLKFTGKYQDTRQGVKADKGLNIQSSVDYEKYLRGNYPKHVGLTKDSGDEVGDLIADEVGKLIKEYLVK